jgi:hypothetical protein
LTESQKYITSHSRGGQGGDQFLEILTNTQLTTSGVIISTLILSELKYNNSLGLKNYYNLMLKIYP